MSRRNSAVSYSPVSTGSMFYTSTCLSEISDSSKSIDTTVYRVLDSKVFIKWYKNLQTELVMFNAWQPYLLRPVNFIDLCREMLHNIDDFEKDAKQSSYPNSIVANTVFTYLNDRITNLSVLLRYNLDSVINNIKYYGVGYAYTFIDKSRRTAKRPTEQGTFKNGDYTTVIPHPDTVPMWYRPVMYSPAYDFPDIQTLKECKRVWEQSHKKDNHLEKKLCPVNTYRYAYCILYKIDLECLDALKSVLATKSPDGYAIGREALEVAGINRSSISMLQDIVNSEETPPEFREAQIECPFGCTVKGIFAVEAGVQDYNNKYVYNLVEATHDVKLRKPPSEDSYSRSSTPLGGSPNNSPKIVSVSSSPMSTDMSPLQPYRHVSAGTISPAPSRSDVSTWRNGTVDRSNSNPPTKRYYHPKIPIHR